MMETKISVKYTDVEQYIRELSEPAKGLIVKLREIIKSTAPEAVELISYNMPAFRSGKILVYYAAHKSHIGFYPASTVVMSVFADDLKPYKTSKGAMQFPFQTGIPEELVRKIVIFRLAQNLEKSGKRK